MQMTDGLPAKHLRAVEHTAVTPTDGWYLQAQFGSSQAFVVQAPAAFTQQQVLAFAAQVTYTP